jgi:hypothetical protein
MLHIWKIVHVRWYWHIGIYKFSKKFVQAHAPKVVHVAPPLCIIEWQAMLRHNHVHTWTWSKLVYILLPWIAFTVVDVFLIKKKFNFRIWVSRISFIVSMGPLNWPNATNDTHNLFCFQIVLWTSHYICFYQASYININTSLN